MLVKHRTDQIVHSTYNFVNKVYEFTLEINTAL